MATVEVTAPAQRQAWRDGVLPPVEEVAGGLWSIPVPLPNNPLRYVLVYAMESSAGITLVDAGWNTDEAWDALGAGLETAGFGIGDVRGVLITHIHPDHYGLAGRIREASGAWIAVHPDDAILIPGRYGAGIHEVVAAMRRLITAHGVPDEEVHRLSDASMGIRDWVQAAEPDILLDDSARVDVQGWDVRVIHTPGHSPGHVCFHMPERRLLLSGDHVLPRISPSIVVHTQQPGNPLADFLDSLHRIGTLDVDDVLPAHEWRFAPLRSRVDELLEHHARRLNEVEEVLADIPDATAWEVTLRLHWSRPWEEVRGFMRRAALGETVAHLVLLESRGRIERLGGEPIRWRISQAA